MRDYGMIILKETMLLQAQTRSSIRKDKYVLIILINGFPQAV